MLDPLWSLLLSPHRTVDVSRHSLQKLLTKVCMPTHIDHYGHTQLHSVQSRVLYDWCFFVVFHYLWKTLIPINRHQRANPYSS